MKKTFLIILITVIVAGAGAFYGGMVYSQSKNPLRGARPDQQLGSAGAAFQGARNNNRQGVGFVTGEVMSKDDKSVTLKIKNGGSKIVFYSDTTEVEKFVTGAKDDLEIGKTVVANGTANQDGSITAQSIQVRPVSNPPQQ